ncbi:hypothetical protein O3M35_007644 [Rhynocoris fuscipes]|uniref:Uncharacterized protein n=1 Tax=Rhynocoris fuscipes TaxID=488301 RepID=A0AAW1DCN8_9HEMI
MSFKRKTCKLGRYRAKLDEFAKGNYFYRKIKIFEDKKLEHRKRQDPSDPFYRLVCRVFSVFLHRRFNTLPVSRTIQETNPISGFLGFIFLLYIAV